MGEIRSFKRFETKDIKASYLVEEVQRSWQECTIKVISYKGMGIIFYTDEEIKIGNISDSKKVVHIGCGPVPSTSILIAKKTGASVTGIDKNPTAIKLARSIIHDLGYSKNIEIKHAEASDFNVGDFDVILISHGIKPIDKFLKHISKTMKQDTIAVFRTFSSDYEELINTDYNLKDLFKIGKIATYEKHGSVISVGLFKKQD